MLQTLLNSIELDLVVQIAKEAGVKIMEVYEGTAPAAFRSKTDNSPLTEADTAAHALIFQALRQHYPDIPVISEEAELPPFEVRQHWPYFWLIDPLDGTREFLNRNGEFTVNIALIAENRPVLGVVHAPALGLTYYASELHGARKETRHHPARSITVRPASRKPVAVQSRSHASADEEKVLQVFGVKERIAVGSSLKFCLIADGRANLYYRHGPTMEWDTAAGQAIVEAAGGSVSTRTREPLRYNKPSLKNSSFLCLG